MDIKIIVATHKPYWMPDGEMYVPVHAGSALSGDIGFTPDNTGDHISEKNPNFCELTALYWAYKNLRSDYLGTSHYRRYFAPRGAHGEKKSRIIRRAQMEKLLEKYDVIVPRPRRYYIETNYSHHSHAHNAQDLDTTRAVIQDLHPEYLDAFDTCMKRTWAHMFNMFVMKRELADAYCEWLFSILFELEKRLDISNYTRNDGRVFGYMGEKLLDVWLTANKIPYHEQPYVFLEKIRWYIKIKMFLRRKFIGRIVY